jgi:4-oxalmesaconate hydratase
VRELRRCVEQMGFVGCNLNPDPSGGLWNGPTLADRAFWPLYEAMCELDVPAMIHVSATCNPHFHSTGSHYLGADTTAFMQAMTSGLFRDFPTMRWVIPHGGGAVPYHWGRFKGMGEENATKPDGSPGWHTLDELMQNVFFDTCVYHQPGIDLLVEVVPTGNILFASEMVGAVKGRDPDTGEFYDDTRRYIDRATLTDGQREQIFEMNTRRVYPRLVPGAPA